MSLSKPTGPRRYDRLADMGLSAPSQPWQPDLTDAVPDDFTINLLTDDRVYVRQEFVGMQLMDFAMIQETRVEGEHEGGDWVPVVQIDCAHGEVHAHWYDQTERQVGRTVLRAISSVEDVRQGYDQAADLIFSQWEDNLRRWRSGR